MEGLVSEGCARCSGELFIWSYGYTRCVFGYGVELGGGVWGFDEFGDLGVFGHGVKFGGGIQGFDKFGDLESRPERERSHEELVIFQLSSFRWTE